MPEWGQWLSEQREAAGIKSDGVYVQVLHTEGFLWISAGGDCAQEGVREAGVKRRRPQAQVQYFECVSRM